MKDKTVLLFTDGSTYTFNNCWVDGWMDWDRERVPLYDMEQTVTNHLGYEAHKIVDYIHVTDDLLAVIDKSQDRTLIYHNPKYDLSIDVMSARQRRKENSKVRSALESRIKLMFKNIQLNKIINSLTHTGEF